jgi:hypothetical protein
MFFFAVVFTDVLHLTLPTWLALPCAALYMFSIFFFQPFLGWWSGREWKKVEPAVRAASAKNRADIMQAMQEPSYWETEGATAAPVESATLAPGIMTLAHYIATTKVKLEIRNLGLIMYEITAADISRAAPPCS